MIYNWNIDNWASTVAKTVKTKVKTMAYIKAILSPVKNLKADFDAYRFFVDTKLAYNSQTIVFDALLNNKYDNTLRRIYIETIGDVIHPEDFDWFDGESGSTAVFDYNDAEGHTPIEYSFFTPEFNRLQDFIVHAPTVLTATDIQISATVEYYRLLSKRFKIQRF